MTEQFISTRMPGRGFMFSESMSMSTRLTDPNYMVPKNRKGRYFSKAYRLYLAGWRRAAIKRLGQTIADDLYCTVNRAGFARRFLGGYTPPPLPQKRAEPLPPLSAPVKYSRHVRVYPLNPDWLT